MRHCAFLTLADPTGFVIDDDLLHEPLQRLGWRVSTVPWSRRGVAWSSFDAVVVRSTWDYHDHTTRFLRVLERIERTGVPIFNPLDLIRWNIAKTYLGELVTRGVPTVPTVVRERLTRAELRSLLGATGSAGMVVKPVIGANAAGAFRLRRETWRRDAEAVERYFATRAALVQPFVDAIVTEGEYSLFYFERELSHAVIKAPAPSDFRVQEEHGASIQPVAVTDELRAVGDLAMRAVPGAPLYARVDLVRANGGDGYWVMELELIEPSLYLRMDTAAAGRFANAFARSVRHDGTRGQVTQA